MGNYQAHPASHQTIYINIIYMKTTIIGLLLLATANIHAQEKAQTYQLADAPRYSEETGYGYDLVAKKAARHPSSFLSVCRTVTTK